MDQYTRRIIGFGVHAGVVDGIALCRMFNQAIRGCPAIGGEIRDRALRVSTLTLNQVTGGAMFCTEFTAPHKERKKGAKKKGYCYQLRSR